MKLTVSFTTDPTGMSPDERRVINIDEGKILYCYTNNKLFYQELKKALGCLDHYSDYLHIWKIYAGDILKKELK